MKQTYQQLTEKQQLVVNYYVTLKGLIVLKRHTLMREKMLANKATKRNNHLLRIIRQLLKRKFSPCTTAGRNKHEHGEILVRHEIIYLWVYQCKRKVATYIVCYCALNGDIECLAK
jgi:hypothetical protein